MKMQSCTIPAFTLTPVPVHNLAPIWTRSISDKLLASFLIVRAWLCGPYFFFFYSQWFLFLLMWRVNVSSQTHIFAQGPPHQMYLCPQTSLIATSRTTERIQTLHHSMTHFIFGSLSVNISTQWKEKKTSNTSGPLSSGVAYLSDQCIQWWYSLWTLSLQYFIVDL